MSNPLTPSPNSPSFDSLSPNSPSSDARSPSPNSSLSAASSPFSSPNSPYSDDEKDENLANRISPLTTEGSPLINRVRLPSPKIVEDYTVIKGNSTQEWLINWLMHVANNLDKVPCKETLDSAQENLASLLKSQEAIEKFIEYSESQEAIKKFIKANLTSQKAINDFFLDNAGSEEIITNFLKAKKNQVENQTICTDLIGLLMYSKNQIKDGSIKEKIKICLATAAKIFIPLEDRKIFKGKDKYIIDLLDIMRKNYLPDEKVSFIEDVIGNEKPRGETIWDKIWGKHKDLKDEKHLKNNCAISRCAISLYPIVLLGIYLHPKCRSPDDDVSRQSSAKMDGLYFAREFLHHFNDKGFAREFPAFFAYTVRPKEGLVKKFDDPSNLGSFRAIHIQGLIKFLVEHAKDWGGDGRNITPSLITKQLIALWERQAQRLENWKKK